MREIKFRVFDNVEKKFLYNGTDFVIFDGTPRENEYGDMIGMPHWSDLEQFTGLYDKYGKEIYEGDLIEHKDFGEMEVVYCDGSFMITDKKYGRLLFEEDSDEKDNLIDIEAIANIHEAQQ